MPRRLTFTRLAAGEQPLFYLTICFAGGILASAEIPIPIVVWMTGAGICRALATVDLRRASLLLGAAFFLLGGALERCERLSVGEDRVRRLVETGLIRIDEPVEVWGRLSEMPEPAPDRIYLLVQVSRISTSGREQTASGVVRLVVPFGDPEERREYDRLALEAGDGLRIYCHLRRAGGFRNPGVRPFDLWLDERNLDAAGSIKSPLLIEKVQNDGSPTILAPLHRFRAASVSAILRRIPQPTSGLLVAALFGNRHFIDRRLGESFRAGGTFHLLVISGLHVTLIAAFLYGIVSRLIRSLVLRQTLVLATIWAYAVMVGAQPAVTRAAWMLSVALLARLLWRESAGPNALAAAAMALLVYSPQELFNPGFQLSFLTVAMIVMVSGPVYLRLKAIGEWRPTEITPWPPQAPRWLKFTAEILFWNERRFRREMRRSAIRYRLEKTSAAAWAAALHLQTPLVWIATTLLTTLVVQIGMLPMTIALFHRISLSAPAANLAEAVLVLAAMAAGGLFLLAHFCLPQASAAMVGVNDWIGRRVLSVGEVLAGPPGANLVAPDHGMAALFIYPIFFLVVCIFIRLLDGWNPMRIHDARRLRRRVSIVALVLMLCVALLLIVPPSTRFERGRLSVTFLDVGQGDAIVIAFPHGQIMLLDSGGRPSFGPSMTGTDDGEPGFIEDRPGVGQLAVAPFLWHRGVRRIDYLAASHGDADHVGGFAEIARLFRFGKAICAAMEARDPFPAEVQTVTRHRDRWQRGDRIRIDGATIDVLSPFAGNNAEGAGIRQSSNDRSLVLRLQFGTRRFLLTGDIERESEARLVAAGEDLRADILKVAHHGSRTSTTAGFLSRVGPEIAVISVAAPSPFGHPHPEVMTRLKQAGAKILKTSDCGAITISTDGSDLKLETFTKCE